ncbi:MAG: amidohydrolase family protein, partial [Planctomycetaceae bacterium]|nr:amidohydrolase family protein [Planctomycetaceae bacterium]
RREVIDQCRTRILLALNLASPGETTPDGCFADEARASVSACVETLASGDPALWGIACNVSEIACEQIDPQLILRRGLEAAEQAGKPLLFGVHHPARWSWEEQLSLLRPGDVMTYLYRDEAWNIVELHPAGEPAGNSSRPQIRPAVRAARERGILFDVGHGCGSFVFPVAQSALAAGFPPDTISTDGQLRHVGWNPVHDLPRVMSKLLAAGMPEADVFAAVTSRPAQILGLAGEVGELTPGACADLTVLEWQDDAPALTDIRGNAIPGGCWSAVHVIRGGQSVAEHGQLVDP